MGYENLCLNGVADYDTSFEIVNRGYEEGQYEAGQWFETTEDVYQHFLGALPPLYFDGSAFVMSEPSTCSLSEGFIQIDGRYFCLTMKHFTATIADDIRAFQKHIAEGAVE